MYLKWGVGMKNIERFYSKEASDYVRQVVEQYQHVIDKFYVLFIFESPKVYLCSAGSTLVHPKIHVKCICRLYSSFGYSER